MIRPSICRETNWIASMDDANWGFARLCKTIKETELFAFEETYWKAKEPKRKNGKNKQIKQVYGWKSLGNRQCCWLLSTVCKNKVENQPAFFIIDNKIFISVVFVAPILIYLCIQKRHALISFSVISPTHETSNQSQYILWAFKCSPFDLKKKPFHWIAMKSSQANKIKYVLQNRCVLNVY